MASRLTSAFATVGDSLRNRYLNELGYGSGRAFTAALAASVAPGDWFLDIGCGQGGLRQVVPEGVRYVGLDRYTGPQTNEYDNWTMRPDVVGDAHHLPFESSIFQSCALMHVLEHVTGPERVMAEIFRVLKPNGMFFLDVPFLHEIHHAPDDHYRFTRHGLAALAHRSGFEIIEIRPSGGYFRAISHVLKEAPVAVSGTGIRAIIIRALVAYPLRFIGWAVEKTQYLLDSEDTRQEFTTGYHCIFRKASG